MARVRSRKYSYFQIFSFSQLSTKPIGCKPMGFVIYLTPKVGNSSQTTKHHSKNLPATSQKEFTTKLSSLSSMGTSPPFPQLRNPDTNTQLNPHKQGHFRKKTIFAVHKDNPCRTIRESCNNTTGVNWRISDISSGIFLIPLPSPKGGAHKDKPCLHSMEC